VPSGKLDPENKKPPPPKTSQTINVTANAGSLAPGMKHSATLTFISTDPKLALPNSTQVTVTMTT
jgi:hypothetical protein